MINLFAVSSANLRGNDSHGFGVGRLRRLLIVLIIHPFNALTFVPDAFTLVALWSNEYAFAMLFAVGPLAFIGTTIWVGVDAVAMLLVIYVFAFIFSAIGPHVHALAMHIVF